MKKQMIHPTWTAYYRDLERDLFTTEGAKEHGDNLIIEHEVNGIVNGRTTLGAIKMMAFDELMQADPVAKLREAMEGMLNNPNSPDAVSNALVALRDTKNFGKYWNR